MESLKRCFPTLPVAGNEEHHTARVLGVISPPRVNSLHPPRRLPALPDHRRGRRAAADAALRALSHRFPLLRSLPGFVTPARALAGSHAELAHPTVPGTSRPLTQEGSGGAPSPVSQRHGPTARGRREPGLLPDKPGGRGDPHQGFSSPGRGHEAALGSCQRHGPAARPHVQLQPWLARTPTGPCASSLSQGLVLTRRGGSVPGTGEDEEADAISGSLPSPAATGTAAHLRGATVGTLGKHQLGASQHVLLPVGCNTGTEPTTAANNPGWRNPPLKPQP